MRTILTILTVLLIAGTALAGNPNACDPEADTGATPVGHYYVDNDVCDPTVCLFSIWVYEAGADGQICTDDDSIVL